MSGSQNTVTVTVDIQAKLNQFEQSLDKIKQGLKQLKVGDSVDERLRTLFRNYEKEAEKIRSKTAKGKLSIVDEKQVNASFERIEQIYNALVDKLESKGIKTSFLKEDAKTLSTLRSLTNQYDRALKETNKRLEKSKDTLAGITAEQKRLNQLTTDRANDKKSIDAQVDAAKAAVDQAKLSALLAKQEYVTQHGNARGFNLVDPKNYQLAKEATKTEEEYIHLLEQQKTAEQAAAQATQQSNQYTEEKGKEIEKLKQRIAELEQQEKQQQQTATANLQSDLLKKLQDNNIDLTKYGIDPASINSWDDLREAIKKVQEVAGQNVAGVFDNINQAAGDAGRALGGAKHELDQAGESLKTLDKNADDIEHFKKRIEYFFGLNNAVRLFQRALRSAFNTVKDLDKVMTETAVVTDFSVGDMWAQLPEYTERANELGLAIHDVYEASTLYYQQGLKTNEVMAVTNATLRMARIAGLDAADATDRVTNALRGFNMEITEANANNIADVYSKLAAMSASNVDEISTAMTKVASLANNANMDFETTAAFLAQIIETTRESAETAGTALKTVVARFSEVKKLYSEGELLGTDEEGEDIDVNKVSTALRTAGINLNEFLTGQRGLDEIFTELASKWDSLTIVQQRYIATMAAGSRQQSRFIALMSDYARTQELVNAAQNASGASQAQYEKTLESLETKLNRLKNAWNEFVMGLANDKAIKWVVDAITNLIGAVNKLTAILPDAAKSVSRLLLAFGAFGGGKAIFNTLFKDIGIAMGTQAATTGQGLGAKMATGMLNGLKMTFTPDKVGVVNESIINAYKAVPGLDKLELEGMKLTELEANLSNIKVEGEAAQAAMAKLKAEIAAAKQYKLDVTLHQIGGSLMGIGTLLTLISNILKNMGLEKASQTLQVIGVTMIGLGATLPKIVHGFQTLIPLLAKAGKGIANFFSSIAGSLGKGGTIGLIVAALVLVATAITAIVVAASKNAPIKRMKKELERLQEEGDKLKETYNSLKDSMQSISEAEEAVDNMIKGTSDWTEAVLNLNQQYLDLVNTIPALRKFLELSDNGHLTIDFDQKGVQDVLTQYQHSIGVNMMAQVAQQQRIAQYELDHLNLRHRGTDIQTQVYAANESGAATRRTINTRLSEDQALDIAKYLRSSDLLARENGQLDLEKINNTLNDEFSTLLDNGGTFAFTEEGVNNILAFSDRISEATSEVQAYNQTLRALIVENTNLPEEIQEHAEDWLSDAALEVVRAGINERLHRAGSEGFSETSSDTAEAELFSQYSQFVAEWLHTNVTGVTSIEVHAGKVVYEDAESESHDVDLRDEFEAYLMANESEDYLREQWEKYNNFREGTTDQQLLAKLYGDQDALVQDDIYNLISLFDAFADGSEVFEGSDAEQLFGNIENFNEFINHLNDTMTKTDDTLSSLETLGISPDLKQVRKGLEPQIAEMFGEILETNGLVATRNLNTLINNALEDVEDDNGFLKYITEVSDWSKKDLSEVRMELADLGIYSDESAEAIDHVIEELKRLDIVGSRISFEDLKQGISDRQSLINDIQSRESNNFAFSDEQKALLEQINPEWRFVYDGENWQWLGTDLNQLITAINANTESNYQAVIEEQAALVSQGEKWEEVLSYHQPEEYLGEEASPKAQAAILRQVGYGELIANATADQIAAIFTEIFNREYGENGGVYQINRDQYNASQGLYGSVGSMAQSQLEQVQAATTQIWQGEGQGSATDAILGQAQAYGVATEELAKYNALLEETGLESNYARRQAAQLIKTISDQVGLARAGKLMEDYGKAIGDDIQSLADLSTESVEYQEAIDNIERETERYLDLNLGEDFLEQGDNLQLLQDALSGDSTAWEQFHKNAMAASLAFNEFTQQFADDSDFIINTANAIDNLEFDAYGTADVSDLIQNFLDAYDTAEGIGEYLEGLSLTNITFEAQTTGQSLEDYLNNGGTVANIRATHRSLPFLDRAVSGAGGGSGGGGGGGGGSKKSWKNPYDELYNLTEKINEALRQRNILEEDYDRLLQRHDQDSTSLYRNSLQQIDSLNKEIQLQKQLRAGRLSQLSNVGNEKVETEDGFKTYAEMGVTKYANYNPNTGLLQIDWEGINQIEDTEVGKAVEEYVKRLEELQGQIEDTDKTIREMEDDVYEIRQRGKQDAIDMENRIAEALQNQQQKIIDEYQALSDTIADSNSKVLDSLQESIDLSRQIRDNTKTEEDIAEKEARLAYLKRDTSGANMLEIQQLEQELEDARQSYTDTLIDQSIDRLSSDNQKAADQRAQQIEIMQSQLDYAVQVGEFVAQAHTMVLEAVQSGTWNTIKDLLMEDEGFKYLSEFAQQLWLQDLDTAIGQTTEGVNNFLNPTNGTIDQDLKNIETAINNGFSTASSGSGGNDSGGSWSPGSSSPTIGSTGRDQEKDNAKGGYDARATDFSKARKSYEAIKNTPMAEEKLKVIIDELNRKWGLKLSNTNPASLNAYKSGGLADFTGPAWLDGSKSRPELVLNARDTENFIALRNILAHLLNGQAGGANTNTAGEINFDIDVNVDQIANDYDVDRLVERVKSNIYQDASYRNINQINFIP